MKFIYNQRYQKEKKIQKLNEVFVEGSKKSTLPIAQGERYNSLLFVSGQVLIKEIRLKEDYQKR